jgi:hypothetical protein
MKDFLFWTGIALLLIGMLVFFAGKFWHYGAKLLRFFFELDLDPEKAFWVALVGAVMVLVGFGLCYLAVN